jgi:hypothetical protein
MTYSPKVIEIIRKLKFFLTEDSTKLNFRSNSEDFIRKSGKLNFYTYVLLGISVIKNSLAVEVYNLLTINKLNPISKSAYSQSRYKIQSKLYQVLNNLFLSLVYEVVISSSVEANTELSLKKWRGYFLEAIDGTCLVLAQTKELGDYFGKHKNGAGKSKIVETVMAKCLVRADLLNKYVVQNEVFKTTESELSICKTWLWQLNSNSISIFDRGFGSAAMFAYLVRNNKPFVCRLKISFNRVVKDFMAGDLTDTEVYFTIGKSETFVNQALSTEKDGDLAIKDIPDTLIKKGTTVLVRLVKVVLPSGEIEVLATNLMDKTAITVADLADLYRQRWGVETVIDSLKNQLLMMVFSGLKPEAILQDIYATIFVYNLRQLLINEAQLLINEQVKENIKPNKYEQKVNKNVALGLLKTKIITLFLVEEPEQIIEDLVILFAKNKIPVIPNKQTSKRQKSLAKRRNLITQNNYRKAI